MCIASYFWRSFVSGIVTLVLGILRMSGFKAPSKRLRSFLNLLDNRRLRIAFWAFSFALVSAVPATLATDWLKALFEPPVVSTGHGGDAGGKAGGHAPDNEPAARISVQGQEAAGDPAGPSIASSPQASDQPSLNGVSGHGQAVADTVEQAPRVAIQSDAAKGDVDGNAAALSQETSDPSPSDDTLERGKEVINTPAHPPLTVDRTALKIPVFFGACALTVWLAARTVDSIGSLAAVVESSGNIDAVDVLMLPISELLREDVDKDTVERKRQVLEGLYNGGKTKMKIDTADERTGLVDADFALMTTSDVMFVSGGRDAGSPKDYTWQQAWRSVGEQVKLGRLSEIILVRSKAAQSSDDDKEFEVYTKVLAYLLERAEWKPVIVEASGLPKFKVAPSVPDGDAASASAMKKSVRISWVIPESNGLEPVQNVYHSAIKGASKCKLKIGIDITSGNRIFAFAAGLSALHDDAVMFYTSKTREDGSKDDEPVVRCYDVRPRFRSS